jgi:positive regulator of sigma E activity
MLLELLKKPTDVLVKIPSKTVLFVSNLLLHVPLVNLMLTFKPEPV